MNATICGSDFLAIDPPRWFQEQLLSDGWRQLPDFWDEGIARWKSLFIHPDHAMYQWYLQLMERNDG